MQSGSSGGFNLYYGNDAEALVERLAARLTTCTENSAESDSVKCDLLAPEIILVPQFGLRRWLEIRLAERCGIIANVDFFAPAEYAWRLLRAARAGIGRDLGVRAQRLALANFRPNWWNLRAITASRHWPGRCGDGSQGTRWRLADELAHLFERYLAYRSDLLARWEHGDDAGTTGRRNCGGA